MSIKSKAAFNAALDLILVSQIEVFC